MEKPFDLVDGEARRNILACIGDLRVCSHALREALIECDQIEILALRALSQPRSVAMDTFDPLPDRMAALAAKLATVVA